MSSVMRIGLNVSDNSRQIDVSDKNGEVRSLVVQNDKIDKFVKSRENTRKNANKVFGIGAVLSLIGSGAYALFSKAPNGEKRGNLLSSIFYAGLGVFMSWYGAGVYKESKLQKLNDKFIKENL